MNQLNYTFKRLLQMIPVLFLVTVLTFLMLRLIPGDPARLILGDKAQEVAIEALREKMGLNEPLVVQYWIYLKGLLTLDLGTSLKYQMPVSELIVQRLPITVILTLTSTALACLISFPVGYMAGKYKDRLPDQVVRTVALISIAMPTFWVALLLMLLFGVVLGWLPVGGWGMTFGEHVKSLLLPAFTQSLMTSALVIRNLRNSVVDISRMDYVDFARSKGISEGHVKQRHILRNAMIPTVTLVAMRMAHMLGGSVIIETVFSLPGIGRLMIEAINGRDYSVIQSLVFVFATMVLLVNLLTDLLYSFLDPRVTFD